MENDQYSLRWDAKQGCVMVSYNDSDIEQHAEDFIGSVKDDCNLPRLRAIFSPSINGGDTYQQFSKVARTIDAIFDAREQHKEERADFFNNRSN